MALQPRQTAIYTDTFSVYRHDTRDANSLGDIAVVRPVTAVQNKPCKLFTTSNFDLPHTPLGQSKTDNIMTSDELHCELALDVRTMDIVKIVTGPNGAEYFTVTGAPRRRSRANVLQVYLSATTQPALSASAWGA